jgi:hypothetical protein
MKEYRHLPEIDEFGPVKEYAVQEQHRAGAACSISASIGISIT